MDKDTVRKLILEVLLEERVRPQQLDIRPTMIKALHNEDAVIKIGLAANRPTSGSPSSRAFFSSDTFVLSI